MPSRQIPWPPNDDEYGDDLPGHQPKPHREGHNLWPAILTVAFAAAIETYLKLHH